MNDDSMGAALATAAPHSQIHPAPVQFSSDQLAVDPILHFFHFAHLPAALRSSSQPFCGLASLIVEMLPRNAERSVALRKLLEAKDAAVRANVGGGALASGGKGDFRTRLKIERDELAEKLRLLDAFLARHPDDALVSAIQREMLVQQKTAMTEYLAILTARIENIEHWEGQERRPVHEGLEEEPEVREVGGADQDRDEDPLFGS